MGADPGPLNSDAGSPADVAALADGRWSAWRGLTTTTAAQAMETQLGPALDTEPKGGVFGGSPTMFRRWPPRPGAPQGLTVWFEGDLVVGIDVPSAARNAEDADLPAADADLDSRVSGHHRQWVWAARGLVLHVTDVPAGGRITAATRRFGLPPFTPTDWESDPLRWWGSTRLAR